MVKFPNYTTLSLKLDERNVLYVTLNRPDVHNAFNEVLINELTTCANTINDSDIRVVVLTGAGKSFCAGADLNYMKKSKDFTFNQNIEDATLMSRMFENWNNLSSPIVGKINGSTIGGGIGLVVACDISIASSRAKFGFTEIKLGMIPAVISQFVITKIGIAAAREYFLTGKIFTADMAEKINLINYVVPTEDLDLKTEELVKDLLICGPNAMKACKKLIRNNIRVKGKEITDYAIKTIAELRQSEEGQEGMEAFFSKRPANWIKKNG